MSARLAAWQTKVEKVENEGESALPPALARIAADKDSKNQAISRPEKPIRSQPKLGHVASAVKQQSPQKSPQKSPMKSPQKLGPGTKSIQDRLNQMQQNWKENDITEKMKGERKAELEALNNRWKNGLPDDGRGTPATTQEQAARVSYDTLLSCSF